MTTTELIKQLREADPKGTGAVYFWNDARATNPVSVVTLAKGSSYRQGYHHADNDVVLLPPVDW